MDMTLVTSVLSAKQAATQQVAEFKIMKKQHEMEMSLIDMLTEVVRSAPAPSGQGAVVGGLGPLGKLTVKKDGGQATQRNERHGHDDEQSCADAESSNHRHLSRFGGGMARSWAIHDPSDGVGES